MALNFLQKLADKLIGKAKPQKPTSKKTNHQKETRGRNGTSRGKQGTGSRKESDNKGRNTRPSRASRKGERPEGNGRGQPRKGGRPSSRRSGSSGSRPERSPAKPSENLSQETRRGTSERSVPHSARSVARPRREREVAERMNTASGVQRPGGAVTDGELEKRRAEHAAWSLDLFQVPEVEGKKRFHDFDLPLEIMHAVAEMNFQYCTPIQAMSLEHALAGKNVAGRAQTGTGKTAAFLVAILTRYLRTPEGRADKGGRPRALVIAPTRELVIQICKDADSLGKYCDLRSLAVYGGMDYDRQKREVMDAPVDLLVATPGRLLDFVRSRVIDLSMVDTLVIDEADRMLDMGFIPDVRSIIRRLPPKEKRCTMLYSATLSEDVMNLASQWMEAPVRVETEAEQVTTKTVKQVVYVVTSDEKFTVLYNHIQQYPDSRILIFCNRRSTTDDVAESLARRGVRCETLSGDVHQSRRLRVLEDFRSGKTRIVVATDVAGRGLHVDDIGFVINFDFPYAPEDYVHRIGRTGRAGQKGVAISFADEDESFTIPEIEDYIGEELKCTMLRADDPLLAPIPKVTRSHHRRGRPMEEAKASKPETAPQQGEVTQDETPVPAVAESQPSAVDASAPVQQPVALPVQPEQQNVQMPAPAARQAKADTSAKPEKSAKQKMPAASVQKPASPRRIPRFSEEWVPGSQK